MVRVAVLAGLAAGIVEGAGTPHRKRNGAHAYESSHASKLYRRCQKSDRIYPKSTLPQHDTCKNHHQGVSKVRARCIPDQDQGVRLLKYLSGMVWV